MGKNLIIRRGGGGADCTPYINELAISQGLLAYSNLILSADHANDLDNGKSFGFDNVNAVQYKALHGTYSESVSVNPSAGATTLILNTTAGLIAGQEKTLQDGSNKEDVIIASIDSGTVVTVPAITNSYTSAYLYDYYVGNPVGVVDYDFRADVLANVGKDASYNFNGTTSKSEANGGSFTIGTVYFEVDLDNITNAMMICSFNNDNQNYIQTLNGNIQMASTGGLLAKTEDGFLNATGIQKVAIVVNGSSDTDIYVNGVKATLEFNDFIPFSITRVSLGYRENGGANYVKGDFGVVVYTDTIITEQQGLDITSGVVELDTVLTEANSEIYLDPSQDSDSGTIENLGTASGYDLISTDVTLTPAIPNTPMDLITQSYTLTNASGATLQHFAKFGTGSYNLMAETSTDNFAYEHSTEEENIKIKTTVVGDTSQLLDIQLELGGVSNV